MSDEQLKLHIIAEIQRLATKNGGQPPGNKLFTSETGIREHEWRGRIWSKWGDALTEAGHAPNEFTQRADSSAILRSVADLALHIGHVPTNAELMIHRRSDGSVPSSKTVTQHFKKLDLLAALSRLAEQDHHYAQIASMMDEVEATIIYRNPSLREGWVYLISSGAFYKIGRSDTLERRVKEIRVAQPEAATLLHAIRTDDPAGIETYWHRRFADQRANGEWFKLTKADVTAFKRRKYQ